MKERQIEGLMEIAMNNIRDMVDVNTIIGAPIDVNENVTIIPISKVGFGFVAGGSEFAQETIEEYKKQDKDEEITYRNPFGGGSGAGVNITPVSFLVINNGNIKLMPVEYCSTIDKLADYLPEMMSKIEKMVSKKNKSKNEEQTISYKYNDEDDV